MFKVGDWIIHDFEIKQITEMEGEKVTEVSSGQFCSSSTELHCYHLTLKNKNIADYMGHCYRQIRELEGSRNLNWPDISGFFRRTCSEGIEGDADAAYKKAQDFVRETREILMDNGFKTVNGVRLFR